MTGMDKAIEMRDVSVIREGTTILHSIDLEIGADENVAIIGPNGSGKTTLLKTLRGEILPYYDEDHPAMMRIFGKELWDIFELKSMIGTVSMDLQSKFDHDTTVSEVIMSGYFGSLDVFRNHMVSERMAKGVLDAAYRMGLDDIMDRECGKISLGEMRRALIARAMINNPRMIILDEPMTGLDVVMKDKFRKMFDILIGDGQRIIMITHDLEDIPDSIVRVLMIKDGRVFADGPKDEMLTSSNISRLYDSPVTVERRGGSYHMYLGV